MLPTLLAQDVNVDQLDAAFQTGGVDAWDWLRAGIIFAVAILLAVVVRRLVARLVRRNDGGSFVADLLGRLGAYLVVVVGLVYGLSALGVRIGPLLGALGIVGIALAFALKDILENFVAGIILQIRRPFRKGDQIETDEHEGTVIEVNARAVLIDQPDGTRVIVPSSSLITKPIVNLTGLGARRTGVQVGVAYDTDLVEARRIIHEAMVAAPRVLESPPPEALVSEFGDDSIVINARFWHSPSIAEMWQARDEVAVAIKGALDDAGITIAFPQRVVWLRHDDPPEDGGEGTSGAAS